jgi:hypothetical protein
LCLAMYLFTDKNIKEIEWKEDDPAFYIEKLNETRDPKTFKWNTESFNVYYLGSSEGCGCGWNPINIYEEAFESEKKINERNLLVSTLQNIDLKNSWMVVCWEGDQGRELLLEQRITLKEIGDPFFEFEQLRVYTFD